MNSLETGEQIQQDSETLDLGSRFPEAVAWRCSVKFTRKHLYWSTFCDTFSL